MFDPYPAERIFHHVADDPVRREKLRRRRDPLLCDLYILLKLRECVVFQPRIVVLIHPPDDLDLSFCLHVEIILRYEVDQHADHAVTCIGDLEEQLHIVIGLFKQSRQDLVQLIALLYE